MIKMYDGHKLTDQNIDINTYWSDRVYEDMVNKIKEYELDEKSTTRFSRRECKSCFYLKGDRVVTQAFTNYECKNCGDKHIHHNGGTPKYCVTCSNSFDVCVRCGGKL